VRIAYLSAVEFSDLLNQGFRETGLTGPLLALCLLSSAYGQTAQISWDVQQDRPVPQELHIWRGETVDLMPRLVQGTRPVALTNAPVEFRYREAALATNQYRSVTAAANTNSGVLLVRWLPDYDAGAAWYDWQIIVGSNAANPRAFGRITMRGTIGHPAPGTPPPPVTLYPTRADLQAVSNSLAASVQTLGGTVAGIGSNVVDLAAAVAAIPPPTRVLNPTNAHEWTDGAGGKWRVDLVYSNFWRVTASEIGFTNDFSSTNPLPTGSLTSVNDGDIALTAELFYDAQGENPYISILLNAMSFNMSWTGGCLEGAVTSSITLDPYFGPTIPATLVWTSVPMSVTSRVDTVALVSDLNAIPRYPTNSLAGWIIYDPGSNVWLQVSVSNFSFTVWEVN